MNSILLLNKEQYVHVLDNNSGKMKLIEGPFRGPLQAFESIYSEIRSKHVLKANEYCQIINPYKENKNLYGQLEIRRGPLIFSLYPGERIKILDSALSLTENQGIYIINKKTGIVRLELGPKEVFLDIDDIFFYKTLSNSEYKALGFSEDLKPSYEAIRIDLDENQIIQLIDNEKIRIELGPKRIFLGPFERPRVFRLSGGTPKRPGVVTTAVIRLGPDFLTDILNVRTRDNADLQIHVRYKWRINLDMENLAKVFGIEDLIGYASETIASMLRGVAAQHDFETFHAKSAEIIKSVVFGNQEYREFENGFVIFAVDIKQITPLDPNIADKLNIAISNNMDVYVKKIQQKAELDAKKQIIESEKVIETQRKELLEIQLANLEREEIEKAKIESESTIEKAKGQAQIIISNEEKLIQVEKDKIESLISILKSGSSNYLKLMELEAFKSSERSIIVPSDSRIWIPIENNKHSQFSEEE